MNIGLINSATTMGRFPAASAAEPSQTEEAPEAPGDEVEVSGGNQRTTFSQLDQPTKQAVFDKLTALNRDGRLFVETDQGLKRAQPFEVRQALDGIKGKAHLVTALSIDEIDSADSRDSFEASAGGFFLTGYTARGERSASDQVSTRERISYVEGELHDWDDIIFMQPGERGVTGTQFLPPTGGVVERSNTFELHWLERSVSSSELWGGWGGAGAAGRNDHGHEVRRNKVNA